MTYIEWIKECLIPALTFIFSFTAVCGAVGTVILYKQQIKRKIALWIGWHIYHEDWSRG